MIRNLSNMDYSHKRERCGQYIEALEEERRKIYVFQRELPLCLNLVTQAIEACKKEIPEMTLENVNGQSECSEQTTGECGPVLEQFLAIKDSSISNEEDDEDHEEFDDEHGNHDPDKDSEDKNMKSDWLKSVQLWNQPETLLPKEECSQQEMMEIEKRDECMRKDPMMNGGEGRKREAEKDGGGRKQRRCWSSQLHRRFLNALQHLGGPHVATPKQIREFMKVDGLTNDEVKSHLQKYRLHTRRPNQTAPNNGNSQTQHFVVVGGLWVPQSDYSTGKITGGATTSTTTSTGVYGAMAAPPPPQWPSHSNFRPSSIIVEEGSASHSTDDVVVRCSSPAMSSSTRNHYVKRI